MMRKAVNQKTGISRLIAATGYSFAGLAAAWKSEAAFRQEVIVSLLLLPGAIWLGQNLVERVILIGVVLIVMITELLNTAIEYTIDRISTEQHELAGRAKDISSAAVFISLALGMGTWACFLWVRLTN